MIQSLLSHRPLTKPLIRLPLGNIVCVAPQPYVPTTATSPLFPPVLNCQSSTSFGSKFSSDVTIKRSSGYIICKKLELGTVRYRRDWGVRWITCCCLALSVKLRWTYLLLCIFLLESSIFSPQRHVKLCFHCCKAILLRLGSLKYFLSLPFSIFVPALLRITRILNYIWTLLWGYLQDPGPILQTKHHFFCISTFFQSYIFLYHLGQVIHSGTGRNFALLVLTLQRKRKSVHKISNDIACM